MKRFYEKQLGFELLEKSNIKHFGGAYLKNSHAKSRRPISTKRSLHLVLRSSMAKGPLSLLRRDSEIKKIINRQSQKHGVKVYRFANGGNHLHIIVLPNSRLAFNSFIRSISGLIARLVLNVERGRAKKLRLWDNRPYTRLIEWGREYKSVCAYLLQNTLEAMGFVPYRPRRSQKYQLSTA